MNATWRAGVRCASAWLAAALLLAAASAWADPPEAGRWLTQDRSSVVAIDGCSGGLCGRIIGITLDHPTDPPPVDKFGRPQCGHAIIAMPSLGQDGRWHGTILDPRSYHRWRAQIWRSGAILHLRGYLGLPIFGATQVWTPFAGTIAPDCTFRSTP